VRPALLVIACGTVAGLCRQLGTAYRARLVTAVLCLGYLTALLAWYGVASHSPAFALTGQGLWRGMGTLGYPNAAAALLALLLVAAVVRQARHGSAGTHWPAAMASTVLLIGLGATLSRGGLLAAAAGLLGLAALLGPRRVLAALWAPALGAALALAGLLPGLASTAAPRPGIAAGLLALGLAAGTWSPVLLRLLRSRIAMPAVANLGAGVLLAGLGAVLAGTGGLSSLLALGHARFTLASTDRSAAWQAATDVIARHPILGAGPGLRTLSWADPHGGVLVFAYAHNEYLQVLAELGAVGLVLLTAWLAAVFGVLGRCRPRSAGGEAAAAAIAGLITVCTSALLDFSWHFPAIVLTAAALAGCAEPAFRLGDSTATHS
jgi:O-antigen ligase